MIGESNRLGRDGIHYDLFIKVGKIDRDPITRTGSHQPCNLQWGASITHGWHYHHLLSTAGLPRWPRRLLFFL